MKTSVFGIIDVKVVNNGSAKIEKGLQRTGTVGRPELSTASVGLEADSTTRYLFKMCSHIL